MQESEELTTERIAADGRTTSNIEPLEQDCEENCE
jgi:hypothetical protein